MIYLGFPYQLMSWGKQIRHTLKTGCVCSKPDSALILPSYSPFPVKSVTLTAAGLLCDLGHGSLLLWSLLLVPVGSVHLTHMVDELHGAATVLCSIAVCCTEYSEVSGCLLGLQSPAAPSTCLTRVLRACCFKLLKEVYLVLVQSEKVKQGSE